METTNKQGNKDNESFTIHNVNSIALETLKERCLLLQNRVNILEKENTQLSIQCSKYKNDKASYIELETLHSTIAQLTKEKSQLAHHVFIVAYENKKLWERLSHFSKSVNCDKILTESPNIPEKTEYIVPNLVRSQTFTQPQNNKHIVKLNPGNDIKNSLDEFSLKLINNFLLEKSELVNQYEQMVEMQISNEKYMCNNSNISSLCNNNIDYMSNIKKHTEKMEQLKFLALTQQLELKRHMKSLETRKTIVQNIENEESSIKLAEVIIKETTENVSDADFPDKHKKWETPPESSFETENDRLNYNKNKHSTVDQALNKKEETYRQLQNSNSENNQKRNITNDRICPMCRKQFIISSHFTFRDFEIHVQNHFIGDDESDSLQENYDIVANSISNNFN